MIRHPRASTAVCLAGIVCLLAGSCSKDDPAAPAPPPVQDKDEVLVTLENTWNDGDIGAYTELIGAGFVGRFGAPEVARGCRAGAWNRASELTAARAIFSENATPGGSIQDLSLKLTYEEGGWTEEDPATAGVQVKGPLFTKTVGYRLTARMANAFLISSSGAVADLTIRRIDRDDGSTIWKIVAFGDRTKTPAGSVDGQAWSQLKCLYR